MNDMTTDPADAVAEFNARVANDGFANLLGWRLIEWSLDQCAIALDIDDRHLNGLGIVHGGVYATLLDAAATICGVYCTVPGNHRSGSTVSLTVNYIQPVTGGRIIARGKKTGGGRSVFMSEARIYDDEGNIISDAQAVCRYKTGSHMPEGVSGARTPRMQQ